MQIIDFIKLIIRPNGKRHFLMLLSPDASVLDVGCGNNSTYNIKKILPKCKYTGVDIGEYEQTKTILADQYILTRPLNFATTINNLQIKYDAIISSHNIEHCYEREKTLMSILNKVKNGGQIFLSFPCQQSIHFPKRRGTLNYYDDPTHRDKPPSFEYIIDQLVKNEFKVEYSSRNYKPIVLRIVGFFLEPFSRLQNKVLWGTWEFYGFESIIIGRKKGI